MVYKCQQSLQLWLYQEREFMGRHLYFGTIYLNFVQKYISQHSKQEPGVQAIDTYNDQKLIKIPIVSYSTLKYIFTTTDQPIRMQIARKTPSAIINCISRCFSSQSYFKNLDLTCPTTSFKASDLTVLPTKTPSELPEFTAENLVFGTKNTDHMLTIDYNSREGWSKPKISPLAPLEINRFNSSLHYAIQCFEGLKAYKNKKGDLRLFRPECNMYRLKNTSKALCLPDFNGEEFLNCIKQLVKIEQRWIPTEKGFSLYLRPTHISMENTLGVKEATASQLFVVASPTGPYYASGFKPVALYCETDKIRSAPKGYGSFKMGSNYGPTLLSSKNAQAKGYSQCLWLFNDQVVEVGSSNIFFVIKNADGTKELITPQLDGLILPGVTRDSIIVIISSNNFLLRYVRETKPEYKVIQRKIMIQQILEAISNNTLVQAFGAGTAVIVSPVKAIGYKEKSYNVPINEKLNAGDLTHQLFNQLLDIQEGRVNHPWSVKIN